MVAEASIIVAAVAVAVADDAESKKPTFSNLLGTFEENLIPQLPVVAAVGAVVAQPCYFLVKSFVDATEFALVRFSYAIAVGNRAKPDLNCLVFSHSRPIQ